MSSASTLFAEICNDIDALAELPLRVYDISITRLDTPRLQLSIAKPGVHVSIIGQFQPKLKIAAFTIIGFTHQTTWNITKGFDGSTTVNVPAHFTLTFDSNRESSWDPVDIRFKASPSKDAIRLLDKSIVEVAERLMTRISRVDML